MISHVGIVKPKVGVHSRLA